MTDSEHHRWSDDQLSKFHTEFLMHQQQEKENQAFLTAAVNKNTETCDRIDRNTADILQAWNNAQGALKVIAVLGRAVKWSAGLIAAGAIIWYTIRHGSPPSPKG